MWVNGFSTDLLVEWSNGNDTAPDHLTPLVYDQLRRLARHYVSRERRCRSLQATALAHEAFMKLVDQRRVRWQDRAHFFAVAAQQMRRILIDHARLAAIDLRQSRIVEFRFFGGLTIDECAGVLAISPATVTREWTGAKAWLYRELQGWQEARASSRSVCALSSDRRDG